ncbi:MAG: universal stress protein [Actinobacteria bacterium]|nr:universal stress protein [Actinomycetota bacterium]
MFRSIVVGTDGSATATEAVRRATELATLCGAKLHVVSAYKPLEALYVAPDVLAGATYDLVNPEADAQRAAAEAAAGARAAGVEAETYACPGDAAAALIEVAEAEDADLIVVGNRGMTGRGRFLLGSIPNKVSHHAPCTVMIVRTT